MRAQRREEPFRLGRRQDPRQGPRHPHQKLREEINAGVRTPVSYTVELCVKDWFGSIERDPHTMKTLTGQADNWIYPKIGATKLRDFTATDADEFFKELGQVLSKRTLVMIKSTLRRSIRRAQVNNLIARNVVELIDLPGGQPGHPSRAMTQAQASKVLKAARAAARLRQAGQGGQGPGRRDPRGDRDRRASALATNVHRFGHAALGFGRPQRCWRSLRMRARSRRWAASTSGWRACALRQRR